MHTIKNERRGPKSSGGEYLSIVKCCNFAKKKISHYIIKREKYLLKVGMKFYCTVHNNGLGNVSSTKNKPDYWNDREREE